MVIDRMIVTADAVIAQKLNANDERDIYRFSSINPAFKLTGFSSSYGCLAGACG